MKGLVTFSDLSTGGQTTINGANITTGTIKSSNYVSGSVGTSINLSTGAIDSAKFKLSNDGNITATGGTIGGWALSSNALKYAPKSDNKVGDAGTMYLCSGGTSAAANIAGSGSISGWGITIGNTFGVTAGGKLYATGAKISGSITADDGTIGGWTIGSRSLKYASDSNNAGVGASGTLHLCPGGTLSSVSIAGSGSISGWGITIGSTFGVTTGGAIYASAGKIGGWALSSNTLKYAPKSDNKVGDAGTMYLCSGGTSAAANIAGSGSISGWGITIGNTFGVTAGGKLYATGAKISGALTAGVGSSIGGFSIDENSIYNGSWGSGAPDVFMSTGTSGSYTIGGRTGSGWVFGAGTTFGVTKSGGIYATSGRIGKWQIGQNSLYGTSTSNGVEVTLSLNGVTAVDELSNMYASWYSITHTCQSSSDRRLKENVHNIDDSYENFFNELVPTAFNYIDDKKKMLHFGFIAQDVESALLNSHISNFSGVWTEEYYQLNKQEFIAINTWQIQKLKHRVAELEEKLSFLETRLNG